LISCQLILLFACIYPLYINVGGASADTFRVMDVRQ